jgi:hypothetical protein
VGKSWLLLDEGKGRKMSEIARMRRQIAEECQALWLAVYGSQIAPTHAAIEKLYNNLGRRQEELEQQVGSEEADSMMLEIYVKEVG